MKLIKLLFIDRFINFIFPFRCPICHQFTNGNLICKNCWPKLHFIEQPFCDICGSPFEFQIGEECVCAKCIKNPPKYKKSRSLVIYNEAATQIISKLKYNDKPNLAKIIAKFLANSLSNFIKTNNIDIIIPVPIHKKKLRSRKYNQVALIAKNLAQLTNIQYINNFLEKTKNTKAQMNLSKKERLLNLQNAFNINKKYKNNFSEKNFLLIDDVITTGATINECVRTLNKHQIENIFVISFAKTK